MRTAGTVLVGLALVMAASTGYAQVGCQSVKTCPTQVAPPVVYHPGMCCPRCGQDAIPSGLGTGPAPMLQNLCGYDFDKAYVEAMYQQHSDIIGLATEGMARVTDRNLRELSAKIRYEQTKMNQKLAIYYLQLTCGKGQLTADLSRPNAILASLQGLCGCEFDQAYAKAMTALLQQSKCAADLGVGRATLPALRDQSQLVSRTSYNESDTLLRWLNGGVMTFATAQTFCQRYGSDFACQ